MKDIKVSKYSVYIKDNLGDCSYSFSKLYKGVRVIVSNCSDSKYMSLSIKTKKARTCIWKRDCERMDNLIFDDTNHSITCVFENEPKNKCPHTLVFEPDVYDDLKNNIPEFLKDCDCEFSEEITENNLTLVF